MTLLESKRPHLEVGDRVTDMGWVGLDGERVYLDQSVHAGRVSVLFICPSLGLPGVTAGLAKFAQLYDQFRVLDAQVFAVTADPPRGNAEVAARVDLPFPVLSDGKFASGRAVGLAGPLAADSGQGSAGPFCTVIVDPNQRVAKRMGPWSGGGHAAAALGFCDGWAASRTPTLANVQAPVLIIPDVLDKTHCARLIKYWETGERYEGGVSSGEYGRNVPIKNVKVREDVVLPDLGAEAQELFGLFRRRVFPEIKKAFAFQVTRAETLRLGCYDAADGGHFIAHRDDTTPFSAHRRFAMSLALSTGEYEGGYVRFPEYGPQLFRAGTGSAVVFSVSMLHEVTKVTAGRRFILLGFFYGEAEEKLRQKLAAERRAVDAAGPVRDPRHT